MTIDELNDKLTSANEIISNWSTSNADIDDLPRAIYDALEANREAIIEYLKSK